MGVLEATSPVALLTLPLRERRLVSEEGEAETRCSRSERGGQQRDTKASLSSRGVPSSPRPKDARPARKAVEGRGA